MSYLYLVPLDTSYFITDHFEFEPLQPFTAVHIAVHADARCCHLVPLLGPMGPGGPSKSCRRSPTSVVDLVLAPSRAFAPPTLSSLQALLASPSQDDKRSFRAFDGSCHNRKSGCCLSFRSPFGTPRECSETTANIAAVESQSGIGTGSSGLLRERREAGPPKASLRHCFVS